MSEVTRILKSIEAGDPRASQELLPLVYQELRRLAAHRMSRERPDHTLSATALVHEAYLRLVGPEPDAAPDWDGRAHFFGAAAEAMRRILIDRARRKSRPKHGGDVDHSEFDDSAFGVLAKSEHLIAVDDALDDLQEVDAQAATVVKLHFFVGLTMKEVGQTLGISERTAFREWTFARAWLFKQLGDG